MASPTDCTTRIGNVHCTGMKHTARSTELVSDVAAELHLHRFNLPNATIDKSSDVADDLPARPDDGCPRGFSAEGALLGPPFRIPI